MSIEDALAEDVLIAERLDGRPLDGDHGAPARLVSPEQYGFVSTKHLCRVELHTTDPSEKYHPSPIIPLGWCGPSTGPSSPPSPLSAPEAAGAVAPHRCLDT